MIKFLLTLWIFLLHIHFASGQPGPFTVQKIRTIDSKDEDFSDLQFLKKTLENKRVVLLGEQSHGDGATFEAKVRLIKFLHQQMDFDLLVFESPMFDNFIAQGKITSSNVATTPLKESIFWLWSETKEFEELIKYVHKQSVPGDTLLIGGFDCQAGDYFNDHYLQEMRQLFDSNNIRLETSLYEFLERVKEGGAETIIDPKDSANFLRAQKLVYDGFEKVVKTSPSKRNQMMQQTFRSWMAMLAFDADVLSEKEVKVQNPRDAQMADNLIFLSKLYPNKKIIAWGASYHFANEIGTIELTPMSIRYGHRLDSVMKSNEPTDLARDLDGAVPMGKLLKSYFGNDLYSISFSSFDGSFGMLGYSPTSFETIVPPQGSIEASLVAQNSPIAFVDFTAMPSSKFYCSALGNVPLYALWKNIFDGHLFIKTSYPPSFPDPTATSPTNAPNSLIVKKIKTGHRSIRGRVIDAETKAPVSYANIYSAGSNIGVASNEQGEFIFNPPSSDQQVKLIFSSVGYQTDTLTLRQLRNKTVVELLPKTYLLSDIVVRSKPLTAKDIIKLAEKSISENYLQEPHNQELFYRVKSFTEDSVMSNEEATVLLFNNLGYQSGLNQTKNIKGDILQFRNTTKETQSDKWTGVGSLWLMYGHDIVLDKSNVLHHVNYYDATLAGVTEFDGRKVYRIEFVCKKPGAYTVGFGYPSPQSAKGTIYIDVDTYAILKYECLIQRKSWKNKRNPEWTTYPYGHYLTQTYKRMGDRYVLSYMKRVDFSINTNTSTQKSYKNVQLFELLSTNVILKDLVIPQKSMINIKTGAEPKQDGDFWSTHNIVLEDGLRSYDRFFTKQN